MKKTLLFIAAAAMAVGSMDAAKVYWDNTGTDWESVYGYSWTPDFEKELSTVTIDGHTLYVAELDNKQIIFRSTIKEWGDALQSADLDVVEGAVYGKGNIKANGGSTKAVANIVDGKYVPAEQPKFPEMYLVGQMTGWGAQSAYEMSTTDGITYTLNVKEMPAGVANGFKFYGGAWGVRELTVTPGDNLADGTYDLAPGSGNISLAKGGDITFTLVQSDDFTKGKLTIAGQGGEVPPTPGVSELYLIGELAGGWVANKGEKLTSVSEGVYTWTGETEKAAYFAFASKLGSNANDWTTLSENRYNPAAGSEKEISGDGEFSMVLGGEGDSWCLNPGKYELTINTTTLTLSVKKTGSVEEVITYNINGQFTGLEDTDWKSTPMTEDNNGNWTLELTTTVKGGQFGVQQMINGGAKGWYTNGASFDTLGSPWVLDGSVEGNAVFDLDPNTYLFSFNPEAKTLTVSLKSGVETIEVEAGEAVYFNLQGVKVANPENGLFIKVVNGKAEKVVL